jgi:hypothetical protein
MNQRSPKTLTRFTAIADRDKWLLPRRSNTRSTRLKKTLPGGGSSGTRGFGGMHLLVAP